MAMDMKPMKATTGAMGAGLALILAAGLATGAAAQQPKAPPAAAPAPAAKGAAPAAAPGAASAASQSAWVKLCEKAPFVGKDKDGKEIKTEKSICLTHHERIDGNSGMVLVSAAIRQIEGDPKSHVMVMVPLGMALPPGLQIGIYPKDMWDAVNKGDKVDDTKLKPIKLTYALCHAAGCTAEAETTPEMFSEIKAGSGMIVYTMNGNGQPVAFPVPLQGFDAALSGQPVDNKVYGEARMALMKQIYENQQKAAAEFQKRNDELQKMQGAPAQGIAPAAPAATGSNPPAKGPAAAPPPAAKKP